MLTCLARGVVQTLQEIVKTNLKTPLINDSQTLSHLLRRLACGNLKLVQNWYKVAVQNVQNIKVTIVNMQMQCFAVIEWMKFQWSHRCNCFFWGGRGMPLHRTACLLGTKKWWLKWHFQALNSSNHACIMACKLLFVSFFVMLSNACCGTYVKFCFRISKANLSLHSTQNFLIAFI